MSSGLWRSAMAAETAKLSRYRRSEHLTEVDGMNWAASASATWEPRKEDGEYVASDIASTSGARVMCAHLRQYQKYGDDPFRDLEDKPVPEKEQKRNYFELFDVSKKSVIATLPLEEIKHMPRTGERIFLPLHEPEDWVAFKIVDIEYFLRTKEGPLEVPGMLRVTVYVEESK